MKKGFNLFLALFLGLQIAVAQTSGEKEIALSEGDVITDSLQTGDVHSYKLQLDEEQFLFGYVNQQTVDVVITIFNPEGEEVGNFDSPARGKELFQLNGENAGTYIIEVTPFEDETGIYTMHLELVEPIAEDPEGRVDQLMTMHTGDVPGAAVLVMKDGKPVFQKSYGMANLTYDIPMEADTRHNIGSTSKHFLTFGLLLLEEQGKLSLDDDLRKYLPELPEFEHEVTLRNIVTHTSGYREFINLVAMTGRNISTDMSTEKIIEIVQRQPELQNIPGEEFNYNNTGYALATEVIKRVTDTPFPQWMKENVFEPLDMHQTVVRTSPSQIVDDRAMGYEPTEDGGYKEVTDLGGAMGAGGIHTTLGDFSKWIQNLLDPELGSPEMIAKMTTPDTLNNGESTGYGLGLFIGDYKGLKRYQHGGADIAHRSSMMIFPDLKAAVVTQSNFSNFNGSISNDVVDVFFEEHLEEEKEDSSEANDTTAFEYDAEEFEALTGRYELSVMPGFVLTFSRDGDRIYTQATNQPEVDLMATTDSTFNLIGVNASITFHRNEDGSADSLTLHQNGNHIAKKLHWNPSVEEFQEYAGHYFSEEVETYYTISIEDSSLMLNNYQFNEPGELTPANVDAFSGGFPISEVKFIRDEEGNITGFEASNGRTRGVMFEKLD